ncbi:cytoplasmic tRNA 2-thiolation protein 2 [Hylaeus volcanicus]|uniref:cytoplasmic tRNA 2-thiolation protein 2 n=1 Tax=Hylaeus volcanicus TaxID=313075 RepID=UPI0023B85648|nr:cytoplasmic tRNA 2-thiolation protein 2 [Hylaeus volcanicus]
MCTLNALEYDTYETDETTIDTITASTNIAAHTANTNELCKKCGCQDVRISLRGKHRYCKICFLSMLTHKFRATLGKSKLVRPSDTILIEHSGKANSNVLIHLIKANESEPANKKLKFQCKILYVDDGMVKGCTVKERELIRNALAKEADNLQLTTYVAPLTEDTTNILCEEIQSINAGGVNTASNDAVMQKMFNSLDSDTAKDELLRQLRRKLLVSIAHKLNCNKVFVADTSVDLAIKVLTDVSTGRGYQLSSNVGFSDTRCPDVTLLRPLRDFTREDIAGYLECCELTPILNSINYTEPFPASIRSTTKNFVHELDSEFYSTVSTIYRTSEKLGTKIEEHSKVNVKSDNDANADVNETCVLCELSLDLNSIQEGQLSVVQARIFSELVSTFTDSSSSTTSKEVNDSEEKHCRCNNTACTPPRTQPLQPDTIKKYLCYGCKLIFFNSNQKFTELPKFLNDKIQEKLRIMHLREQITNFLL